MSKSSLLFGREERFSTSTFHFLNAFLYLLTLEKDPLNQKVGLTSLCVCDLGEKVVTADEVY